MPVTPYIQRPVSPTVCLLTAEGETISEHGERMNLDDLPLGYRVWCDYDTVRTLVADGRGEALCWNGEEIAWRHERFEDEWRKRRSDVHVIRLPFPVEHERTLTALGLWRSWLTEYGAAPVSTMGGAAWSLLRARLTKPLWCTVGELPPLRQTLGGRQELGPRGQGSYTGLLEHYDLSAAYASELSGLSYGGQWCKASGLPLDRSPAWWAASGRPVFVRAIVRVPADLGYGPLPRRPRARLLGTMRQQRAAFLPDKLTPGPLSKCVYPTGTRIQGVWTWQELAAAEQHGCTILRTFESWVHLSGEQPFLPWWDAVQHGRALGGFAGTLAKMTGNALWGRFAMDVRFNGERKIRSVKGTTTTERTLKPRGGLPGVHDLAETVSGRVRARLFDAIESAGDSLVSAHTDGYWLLGSAQQGRSVADRKAHNLEAAGSIPAPALGGWRLKERARRLDLIDPQVLRYWPSPARASEPWVVYAGVPARQADAAFEDAWERLNAA